MDKIFSGALSDTVDFKVPGTYSVTRGTLTLVNDNYELAEFVPGTVTVVASASTPTSSTLSRATRPTIDRKTADGETTDQPSAPDNGTASVESRTDAATPAFSSPTRPFLTFAPELIKLDD